MNLVGRGMLLFLLCCGFLQIARTQVTQPPFTIELEESTWPEWPGLHSFVIGEWDGRWIIASGRVGGLHGFIPPSPFTVLEANRDMWLLDPQTGEQWSADIFSLPGDIADQLRSTNAQYFQRDKYLYMIGGYGKDTLSGNFITFPSLLASDLDLLTVALISGDDSTPAFRKFEDTLFQVTGGEIETLPSDGFVYLFGGHNFTGEYTKPDTPSFTQEYTNELRKFKLTDDGTTISISDLQVLNDTAIFHRRDLNFEPVVFPGEEFGLVALSGVFQYEADWVWSHPVYIKEDDFELDTLFDQLLNHYTCPVMTIYDSTTMTYFATLFGGIGQSYYNEDEDTIKQDLNVPFVNDISTIVRYADGTTEQVPMPISFDALLGSNMVFVLNTEIPHYENEVIKLHHIDGEIFAGYLFGGIHALIPNFTPSTASNRLFKVWLNYEAPVSIVEAQEAEIAIYPNPAGDHFTIKNRSGQVISNMRLFNQLGVVVYTELISLATGYHRTIDISNLVPGIYFISFTGEQYNSLYKFIVE